MWSVNVRLTSIRLVALFIHYVNNLYSIYIFVCVYIHICMCVFLYMSIYICLNVFLLLCVDIRVYFISFPFVLFSASYLSLWNTQRRPCWIFSSHRWSWSVSIRHLVAARRQPKFSVSLSFLFLFSSVTPGGDRGKLAWTSGFIHVLTQLEFNSS